MSRTFVEALKDKYCDDGDENEENFVVDIVFSNRPRTSGSSLDDVELGYLTNVVLCSASISIAGIPSDGLSSLCPNVVDLDISSNALCAWEEVLSIFHHLRALKFVNLSGNQLGEKDLENAIPCLDQTFGIDDLVLNNTNVTWKQATDLARLLPKLRELHLCQNGYTEITASTERLCESLPLLQCLRLNENNLSRWEDIAKLGSLPQLHTLILSDNPLLNIVPVHKAAKSNQAESSHNPYKISVVKDASSGDDAVFLEASNPELGGASEEQLQVTIEHSTDKSEVTVASTSTDEGAGDKAKNYVQEPVTCEVGTPGSGDEQKDKQDCSNDVEGDPVEDDELNDHEQHPDSSKDINKNDNERIQEVEERIELLLDDSLTVTPLLFQSLTVLCVSNTKLCRWDDINALTTFTKLTSLKIRDIPFQQDASEEERRRLLIASLPNLDILNGSEITPTETEKAEQHYVRYFSDKPDPPKRYQELVQKHGELKSLSVIDIGRNFTEYACLSFIYGGRCIHQETVYVVEPVGKLKKICSRLVRKHKSFITIYYKAKNQDGRRNIPEEESGLEELFLESLPMSRYDMMDEDEIHIDVHQTPRYQKKIQDSFSVSVH